MEWIKGIYIDTCLPFGPRSAPELFNILADLLSWILDHKGASPTMHYVYILMISSWWAPLSPLHAIAIWTSWWTCPSSLEFSWHWKIKRTSPCLTFLVIILDTQLMQARLPKEHKAPTFYLAAQKEGYKETNTVSSWAPPTWLQSIQHDQDGQSWQGCTVLQPESKNWHTSLIWTRAPDLTSIGSTFSSTTGMASASFIQSPLPTVWLPHPHRCLRLLGLWSHLC